MTSEWQLLFPWKSPHAPPTPQVFQYNEFKYGLNLLYVSLPRFREKTNMVLLYYFEMELNTPAPDHLLVSVLTFIALDFPQFAVSTGIHPVVQYGHFRHSFHSVANWSRLLYVLHNGTDALWTILWSHKRVLADSVITNQQC